MTVTRVYTPEQPHACDLPDFELHPSPPGTVVRCDECHALWRRTHHHTVYGGPLWKRLRGRRLRRFNRKHGPHTSFNQAQAGEFT